MMINNELQFHMNLMYFSSKLIYSILAGWYDWLPDLCLQVSKQWANHTEGNKQYLTH